jgi:hypothetical protein
MFGRHYFGGRYFGVRYFGPSGTPLADVVSISAAVIELVGQEIAAIDQVVEVTAGGGGALLPRLRPVVGVGFGVLPEIEGDARGVVVVAGDGKGTLAEVSGAASGVVGIAGRGAGQLQNADAVAIGVGGVHGSGFGMVTELKATAIGQVDDSEGAAMIVLLAA